MSEEKVLLEAKEISKQFNGVWVLKGVNMDVRYGEVMALMGENGAGKSTLIKIITGVYHKNGGEIFIDGEPVSITSRQDATRNGIAVIYQELSLIPDQTVAENVFLGQEMTKHGLLTTRTMNKKVQELIDRFGFDMKANAYIGAMGMAQRQMVEILKALSMDAKLIIMDEPTASLSNTETELLFDTIERLKKQGTAIIYISHRLEEVYRIADRLTIMRDGENVGVLEKGDINPRTVTKMMIGHEIVQENTRKNVKRSETHRIEVKGLTYRSLLKGVDFTAYGGEVLGIGGLVGSGRTEIIKSIYGAITPSGGTITYNGKPVSKKIAKNIAMGFGLVPEDRRSEGFVPKLSIERNFNLPSLKEVNPSGFTSRSREVSRAKEAIKTFNVRPGVYKYPVINLSGGNQQKVVLGKWISRKPKVLLLDEPTAGVDVGVKADIYDLIWKLADQGAIVIMVSSDLAELVHVADRILVVHDGKMFEEFTDHNVSQEAILLASSGEHTEMGRALC